MKDFSIKKVVLCSILLVSGLLLFVGLSFPLASISILNNLSLGSNYQQLMNSLSIDGYDMIGFKIPTTFPLFLAKVLDISNNTMEYYTSSYDIVFGVGSLFMLLTAIVFVILAIFAFFFFSTDKCHKIAVSFFVTAGIAAVYNLVASIFFVVEINSLIENALAEPILSIKTSAYGTLIFLVICLIAYVVCFFMLKGTKSNKAGYSSTADKICQELILMDVIREYEGLYQKEVISSADYAFIKNKLLFDDGKKGDDFAEGEKLRLKLIKENQKLFDDGIITHAECISRKGNLLNK